MRKALMKLREARKRAEKRGDTWGAILGLMVGAFFLLIAVGGFYYLKYVKPATDITTDLQNALNGLQGYYAQAMHYPAGSGWSWDTGEYILPKIKNGGWTYSCSSNTITIETPPIEDDKVRARVLQSFQNICNSASVDGNRVKCVLYNRVCY